MSALTWTPWAMYPTNSCMRRVLCHSRPRTPTIVQESQHFWQENQSVHGFPTTWIEFKWVSWCCKQCLDWIFLQVCSKRWSHFFSTVAKATHWVAKDWRGATRVGHCQKSTQLRWSLSLWCFLNIFTVLICFHFNDVFFLKDVVADFRWWKSDDRDSWSEKSETNLMLKLTASRKWIPQKSKVLYLVTFLKPKSGDFGSLARPLGLRDRCPVRQSSRWGRPAVNTFGISYCILLLYQ